MAANDPYIPDPVQVSNGASTTFDGTASETDTAIVSTLSGNFDAQIFLEAWDGNAWQEVAQFAAADGNNTFSADWNTQFNRQYVEVDGRRIRIDNVDSASGWVAVEGDER
jgi:hypothetical protein